jgi:ParB-like chromosome segregation protein Spo0J
MAQIQTSLIRIGNDFQLKGTADEEQQLEALMASIRANGVTQSIVVSEAGDGHFDVVSGHMAVIACARLMMRSVPAVIQSLPVA